MGVYCWKETLTRTSNSEQHDLLEKDFYYMPIQTIIIT